MKNTKETKKQIPSNNTDYRPNFIIWDKTISNNFQKMCSKFSAFQSQTDWQNTDWLIIDNDTGQIIYPDK